MSYIHNNLMPNEKVLVSARVHPVIFLGAVFSFVFFLLFLVYSLVNSTKPYGGFLLCGSGILLLSTLVIGLEALIVRVSTEFAVTNRRLIAKTGFIRTRTVEILLPKVESVAVRQGILGRLLNFGTVTVTGTGGTRESFRAISDPYIMRKKINRIIEHFVQAPDLMKLPK